MMRVWGRVDVGQLRHCRADRVLACICTIMEEANAIVRPLRDEPTEYSNTENEDGETEKRGSKRRGKQCVRRDLFS